MTDAASWYKFLPQPEGTTLSDESAKENLEGKADANRRNGANEASAKASSLQLLGKATRILLGPKKNCPRL
jgi:hypothetical protein